MPELPYATPSGLSDFGSLISFVDTQTAGLLIFLMVIAVWLVSFMVIAMSQETSKAFLAASFITFIVSVFLWAAGFSVLMVIASGIALAASSLYLFSRKPTPGI